MIAYLTGITFSVTGCSGRFSVTNKPLPACDCLRLDWFITIDWRRWAFIDRPSALLLEPSMTDWLFMGWSTILDRILWTRVRHFLVFLGLCSSGKSSSFR